MHSFCPNLGHEEIKGEGKVKAEGVCSILFMFPGCCPALFFGFFLIHSGAGLSALWSGFRYISGGCLVHLSVLLSTF